MRKSIFTLILCSQWLAAIITIHGDADPLILYSHAVRLTQALDKTRVPNELVTIPKGDHGDFSREKSMRAYNEIRKFLKKQGIE
jgi:dipeptidyl aminopeptidase/acylaminoacyl peptidase